MNIHGRLAQLFPSFLVSNFIEMFIVVGRLWSKQYLGRNDAINTMLLSVCLPCFLSPLSYSSLSLPPPTPPSFWLWLLFFFVVIIIFSFFLSPPHFFSLLLLLQWQSTGPDVYTRNKRPEINMMASLCLTVHISICLFFPPSSSSSSSSSSPQPHQ